MTKKDQRVPQRYYNAEVMLTNVGRDGGEISVCATCMDGLFARQGAVSS